MDGAFPPLNIPKARGHSGPARWGKADEQQTFGRDCRIWSSTTETRPPPSMARTSPSSRRKCNSTSPGPWPGKSIPPSPSRPERAQLGPPMRGPGRSIPNPRGGTQRPENGVRKAIVEWIRSECRPFRARSIWAFRCPGRCPGLVTCRSDRGGHATRRRRNRSSVLGAIPLVRVGPRVADFELSWSPLTCAPKAHSIQQPGTTPREPGPPTRARPERAQPVDPIARAGRAPLDPAPLDRGESRLAARPARRAGLLPPCPGGANTRQADGAKLSQSWWVRRK